MSKTTTPNYSPEMVAAIKAAQPLNAAKAADLAETFGKSPRSVIAKVLSLGLPYTSARPSRKDGSAVLRKAEIVRQITEAVSCDSPLSGLVKAPRKDLVSLREALLTAVLMGS